VTLPPIAAHVLILKTRLRSTTFVARIEREMIAGLEVWSREMRLVGLRKERGQVVLMTALSLVALFGMLALAVDVGWAYFTRKSAQRAADAASMAAAIQVLSNVGNNTPVCGTNVTCQSPSSCPSTINNPPVTEIDVACLYAQQNGFTAGGAGGTQSVTVASGTTTPPPTAPGVNGIYYWITVRVMQSNLLWFGSVVADASGSHAIAAPTEMAGARFDRLPVALALMSGGPAARASAGVSDGILGGTLFLLNRQNDTSGVDSAGVDLSGGGSVAVTAPGGIYMASTDNGASGIYAGNLHGTPSVTAPFTNIRGAGTVSLVGNSNWSATPQNGFPDGWMFYDPMQGKGQPPPLPSGGLKNYVPVANGCLDCLVQPLMPGQYYAVDSKGRPTGGLLTGDGTVTFSDNGTGFGNYVFYGGLSFPRTHTTVTFYPGRYVLAGTQSGNDLISYHTQVTIQDQGVAGVQNTDGGEIFIFTDPNYPGLSGNYPPALSNAPSILNSLGLSDVNLQAGNNPAIGINLHGLNVTNVNVPSDLKPFAPTVFWQDQRNSRVKYTSTGNIDTTSCGTGHSLDNPCTNSNMTSSSAPGMTLQAHPNTQIYGLVYQPRGSWVAFQGSGSITSPSVFITGALGLQGGASLQLLNSRDALKKRIVVLIE
jgi:Flp pilus assembly protein TadG